MYLGYATATECRCYCVLGSLALALMQGSLKLDQPFKKKPDGRQLRHLCDDRADPLQVLPFSRLVDGLYRPAACGLRTGLPRLKLTRLQLLWRCCVSIIGVGHVSLIDSSVVADDGCGRNPWCAGAGST